MGLQLHISDSVTQALRLPASEQQQRLTIELAVSLYAQGILSFGKAYDGNGVDDVARVFEGYGWHVRTVADGNSLAAISGEPSLLVLQGEEAPGDVWTLVARKGKVVYHKAFGLADNESNRPLKRDDIFRIASQSKAITGQDASLAART